MNPTLTLPHHRRSPTASRRASAKVGIVGLGYAGLPLALAFAEAGFEVTGHRPQRRPRRRGQRAAARTSSTCPSERYAAAEGRLSRDRRLQRGRRPRRADDLRPHAAAEDAHARPRLRRRGRRVASREHLTPGHAGHPAVDDLPRDDRGAAAADPRARGRLRVGEDFFLGYAPERVDPGNPTFDLRNTPKIVAGVTAECRERTRALYATSSTRSSRCRSPTVAETVKLHENTFRQVNIALANELALMCDRLGDLRLGGHRRRGDQAVRVHGRTTPAPAWAATASRSSRTS